MLRGLETAKKFGRIILTRSKKELKALAEECATKLKPIKQNEARLTSSLRDNQEDQNEIQRAIKKKKDEIKQLETIRSKNANPELKEKLDQARV